MRFNSHFFFRNIFLLVALVSSLLLTACGGGGGGGSAAPATSNVTVTIPGSLLTQPSGNERAAADGSSDFKLKVAAYSEGKKKTDVKIDDRQLTSNGTNYTANVDGLLNAYDYRFIAFYKDTEILSNQISSSELKNGANIVLNVDTSYKTFAYDAWLKKNPSNASMKNFEDNAKTAGLSKDADYSKLSLQIGNDSFTVNQYKANLLTVTKGGAAPIPTSSTASINIDKIIATNNDKTSLYNIAYNLDGGNLDKANPTQYGKASSTITLNNPTKNGYNFKGWTGSNGNVPQTTVTIGNGSTGDKNYTANWALVNYTITYNLDRGRVHKSNPTKYDITSATITLNNPTKSGYSFKGWTGSNGDIPQTTVTIEKGSTGDKTYTANWGEKNLLDGSGTADDPFIVATADDLNNIRLINNGSYFKQTKDIDLSSYGKSYDNEKGWLPIPFTNDNDEDYWFGYYDGNNKKITNLYISRNISALGLFGKIASESVISNLSIETSSEGLGGINNVGILAGISNGKSVTNCNVKGLIVGLGNNIGGMIGTSYSQYLTSCVASCTIYVGKVDSNTNPTGRIGGLVGQQFGNSYTVYGCKSSTKIDSELNNIGGMFGYCYDNGIISNSTATGYVKTHDSFSGGFVGYVGSNVSIQSCKSSTTAVAVDSYVGGFAGINYGRIELNFSEKSGIGAGYVGGFVGFNSGNITRCYSKEDVSCYSENDIAACAGGFAGGNNKNISNCYSLGNVMAISGNKFSCNTGGFVGENNSNATIDKCYALGYSRCTQMWAGGIAGSNKGIISNCLALGSEANALVEKSGRITGENTGTIRNNYAISTMTVNDSIPSSNIGVNAINGETVTSSNIQRTKWWTNTLGFNSSIWSYSSTNKRMELINMPSLE